MFSRVNEGVAGSVKHHPNIADRCGVSVAVAYYMCE